MWRCVVVCMCDEERENLEKLDSERFFPLLDVRIYRLHFIQCRKINNARVLLYKSKFCLPRATP